jgi:hypothetical protein
LVEEFKRTALIDNAIEAKEVPDEILVMNDSIVIKDETIDPGNDNSGKDVFTESDEALKILHELKDAGILTQQER